MKVATLIHYVLNERPSSAGRCEGLVLNVTKDR
jgi:hypothetical protein